MTTKADFIIKVNELMLEYAAEAEHQEGEGYWEDYFETVDEAVDDFALYLKNIRDPSGERS